MFVQFISEEYRKSDINVKRLTDSFFIDTSFMGNSEKTAFGRRLTKSREAAGYKQDEAAKLIGMSQGTLGEAESQGKRSGYTPQLAALYGVNPVWLATGKGDMTANTSRISSNYAPVPLISWVQAGDWSEITDNFPLGDAEEWLPCPVNHGPKTFALAVRGESMNNPHGQPSFSAGDLIFVDPDRQWENGSLVVVRLDDDKEATFKKLIVEGRRKYLRPLNPAWPEQVIEINGNATICGVAIFKGSKL